MTRGALCGHQLGPEWNDAGTLAKTRAAPPTLTPTLSFTESEQKVLLDITQLTLDLVGIVDPTPTADGANVAISLGRKDWFGAGLSAISMVPYLGDLAKVGKLGRWAQTVQSAVELAARNNAFAQRARPILRNLAMLLNEIPTRLLPSAAQAVIRRMRSSLAKLLGTLPARGLLADLAVKRQRMFEFIDAIPLTSPGPNAGVLWSRIGQKNVIDGAELATAIAKANGEKTLEMTLNGTGFVEAWKVASEQLAQKHALTQAEVWESFGRDVWQRVSLRYTQTLRGRVTAYVRFTPMLEKNQLGRLVPVKGQSGISVPSSRYDPSLDPILFDEMEAISEAMTLNPHISSVKLVSIDTGEFKLLEREQLLKALRTTH